MRLAFTCLIVGFWIVVIVFIFRISVPVPGNLSFKQKANAFSIIPQGWGFFTRDPKEPQYLIFDKDGTKLSKSNSEPSNLFGISRKNRLMNIELSLIMSKIKESSWSDYKEGKFDFNSTIISDTISINFNPSSLKGHFFIAQQERLPWAWAKSNNKIVMPYKYARIYVE